jgi:hypothetical protein
MAKKEELIRELVEARKGLEAAMAAVSREEKVYPEWTLKEMLAHIAGWDEVVLDTLQAHARGEAPTPLKMKSIQAYNELAVEKRSGLSYEEVLAEFREVRAGVLETLEAMSQEEIDAPLRFPWGGEGTVPEMVAIFSEHEEEHTKTLQSAVTTPNQEG